MLEVFTSALVCPGKSGMTITTVEPPSRSEEAISRLLEAASYTERAAQRDQADDEIEEVELDEQAQAWCTAAVFRPANGRVRISAII